MKSILKYLLTLAWLLSACASADGDAAVSYPDPSYPGASMDTMPANDSFAPMPEDAGFIRNEVYLDAVQLLTLESYQPQFMLSLKGNLPTPCHQLRIAVKPPEFENKVHVEVYAIADPDQTCAQALAPFEVNYPLGSFPAGAYSLWVNSVKIADFQS
ncbi:MAG: hypothetical protein HXY38_13055 [Chloroflexi bacterium]|nr:hypothetical protein [Chloroflexota bacterium]